jgi:zinc protease
MSREWQRVSRIGAIVLAVAAAAPLAGCATARPESKLQVATETGRLVPLDSVTVSYTVGNLQVIQRPNYANDVVAVHLYLLGGRRQLTPATQGIETMLLRVSKYGTAKYPGDSTRKAWARTGSDFELDPSDDWTVVGFRAVSADFDSSFSVFAERVIHPTIAPASVALVRGQMLSDLRERTLDPDGYVSLLSDSAAFTGRPYALEPSGSESSLGTIDSAALATYAGTQMVTSRMLLVVVGNVDRARVERAVGATLGPLPKGGYVWSLPQLPPPAAASVALVMRQRPTATNYIYGVFEGPAASDKDYAAFHVATAILSSRVGEAVRDEHSLSYAAYAPYTERGISTGGVYVTTGVPAKVVPMLKEQITWVEHAPPIYFGIHSFTDSFIFDYMAKNGTDDAQADFLARAQLYHGDYRKASDAMEDLRHVSMSDVRAVAKRYFTHIQFVYVGDTTRVARRDFASF